MTSTTNVQHWRVGTVTKIIPEAVGIRSYTFAFETQVSHLPGQYYELRLTAEDGYQAVRLYSAAMPANGTSNMLQLTVALMDHGEVSPYIFNSVKIGSQIEIRGPLAKHFVWEPESTSPLLLIGGGTGIIPLRAIRLAHQQSGAPTPIHLLCSARTYYDLPYKYELFPRNGQPPEDVTITFTEKAPEGWSGFSKRLDAAIIRTVLGNFASSPDVFVCGSTPFVENASNLLLELGLNEAKIKAERFGPTNAA